MRDPYELLAVPRSATAADIKKSFRLLAKRLHPDANNNDPKAAALFAELNAAYAILSNEAKRNAFDRGGIDGRVKPRRQAVSHATRRHRFTSSLSHVVTCLVVAVVIPIATLPLIIRSLTPQAQINPSAGGKNSVVSDLGSNEQHAGTAQTQQSDHSVQPEPRVVLQPVAPRTAGDTIPLGAQVIGGAAGLALEISGLPTGMTISSGRPQGAGRWRILATDADNAVIRPPEGFSGAIDLAVELRLADDTIVDRGSLRLQMPIVAPVPIESASGMAVSDSSGNKVTATPAPADQNATHQAAGTRLDHEQIELLRARSQELISQGDVGAARTLLQRAAEARDAGAALALGATYDPIMLATVQARGVTADISLARDWYKKASEFGSGEAQQRLTQLAGKPSADRHEDAKVPDEANKPSDEAGAIMRFVIQRLRDDGDAQATAGRELALGDASFYKDRGIAAYGSGDFLGAIGNFDEAIRLNPNDSQSYNIRGNAWDELGILERALADYDASLRINPNDPAVLHDRAILWQRKGALDKALVDLNSAIRFSSADANIYCDRGLVWYQKGRYDRAITDFDRAIELDPNFAPAYINRGLILHRNREFNVAFADSKPIRIDPGVFDVNRRMNSRH